VILILSCAEDTHADAMQRLLDDRGVPNVRLDPVLFPASARLSVRFASGGLVHRSVSLGDQVLDLDEVTAVWVRRPQEPRPVAELEGTPVGDFVASETAIATADLWETLDVTFVPAPRPVLRRAQFKMRQLQLAAQLGLELPPTLVTNDPDALLQFAEQHDRLITKQAGFSHNCQTPDGGHVVRYTEPLRPQDLVHVQSLELCPLITQAYVPKQLELRVTVVGTKVFTAAIHSQIAHHTRTDWRRYDDTHVLIEPYELPRAIGNALIELNARLGLLYSTSDVVLTPDGRHVYLETNPSGQYLWTELAAGLPITAAIADLLVGSGRPLEAVA
jgi:glutathione synthase/RimK-type ligase-like ATP-grasp enzyme